MLDQAFGVLTSLQEDPNIQHLQIEVHELQEKYENIRGTAQTIILNQRFTKMQ